MPKNKSEDTAEAVGKDIKRLRHAAGLTQQELAPLANIADSTLANYERGRNKPRSKNLYSILFAIAETDPAAFEEQPPETDTVAEVTEQLNIDKRQLTLKTDGKPLGYEKKGKEEKKEVTVKGKMAAVNVKTFGKVKKVNLDQYREISEKLSTQAQAVQAALFDPEILGDSLREEVFKTAAFDLTEQGKKLLYRAEAYDLAVQAVFDEIDKNIKGSELEQVMKMWGDLVAGAVSDIKKWRKHNNDLDLSALYMPGAEKMLINGLPDLPQGIAEAIKLERQATGEARKQLHDLTVEDSVKIIKKTEMTPTQKAGLILRHPEARKKNITKLSGPLTEVLNRPWEDIMHTASKQVKARRNQQGQSQSQVALLATVDHQRISLFERGIYTSWTAERFSRLPIPLGLTTETLLEVAA